MRYMPLLGSWYIIHFAWHNRSFRRSYSSFIPNLPANKKGHLSDPTATLLIIPLQLFAQPQLLRLVFPFFRLELHAELAMLHKESRCLPWH